MYGQRRESSVDAVRTKLLRNMVGENGKLTSKSMVDLARLPPCRSAFRPHVERVNHHLCLYKRANVAILEKPNPSDQGQGWVRNDGGVLEPLWSHEPVLPVSLVDILDSINQEEGDEEESEQEELADIEIFEESDEEW